MTAATMLNPGNGAGHGRPLKHLPPAKVGQVSKRRPCPQAHGIAPVSPTGTSRAIKSVIIGVPANCAGRSGRGGARNSASRATTALTAGQVGNLIAATHHAKKLGLPLNRMVTIHWQAAGLPLEGMVKATGRFLETAGRALARKGHPFAWLYVHEGGEGKGGHCHMLLHVPPEAVPIIAKRQKRWLRSITGRPYQARVIRSEPIAGRLGAERAAPELHALNLAEALSYILKGAERAAIAQYGLTRQEPGGLVIGKRCGWSQNIGAKARKEHGHG